MRRTNPFQPIYDACNNGDASEKHKRLPWFPRLVDIEPTSACNFRCVFCPTGNRSIVRTTGFMDQRTFYSILSECAPHETPIRFIGWGEPLLHPNIVTWIKACTEVGVVSHINTNGSSLDDEMIDALFESGLSSIKISFQGADKATFLEMRKTDFFDELMTVIERIGKIRGDSVLPYIAVSTSTTDEPDDMVDKFRARLESLVDHVSIGKTVFGFMDLKSARLKPDEIARYEKLAELEKGTLRHPDPCPEVYDKISIHWDGTGHVCCNDFDGLTNLGAVGEQTLSEMWLAQQMKEYRERLAKKEYTGKLCSNCFDYACLTKAGT